MLIIVVIPYTICTKSLIHYFWNSDFEFYIATLILRHLNCEVSRRILKCEKDFRYILESRNHLYGKRK